MNSLKKYVTYLSIFVKNNETEFSNFFQKKMRENVAMRYGYCIINMMWNYGGISMKNMNKNLCVKIIGFLIILLCVFTLTACGSKASKKTWDKYVKAVNNKDLDGIAECFTEPESKAREARYNFFDSLCK